MQPYICETNVSATEIASYPNTADMTVCLSVLHNYRVRIQWIRNIDRVHVSKFIFQSGSCARKNKHDKTTSTRINFLGLLNCTIGSNISDSNHK